MGNNSRIEQIRSFLEKTPHDSFLNYALATELIAIDKDDEALTIFTSLIERDPEYFATYYHLAKLYIRMGQELKAEEIFLKGMEVTKRLNENHAWRELKSAYDEMLWDQL